MSSSDAGDNDDQRNDDGGQHETAAERDRRLVQRGIEERQKELHRIADILAKTASTKGRIASRARASIIVLGAFVATQAIAERIAGDQNRTVVLVIYSAVGLIITAVSGLEATFKTESRSADLRSLAAVCHTTIWQIDSEWYASVAVGSDAERLVGASKLLLRQDRVLAETVTNATKLGIDITLDIRNQYIQAARTQTRDYPARA